MTAFNIYCDESCHLEHDGHSAMVLGSVTCRARRTREIAARLAELRTEHGIGPGYEIKWGHVSPAKAQFYLDVVDFFFQEPDLTARFVVVDKAALDHAAFKQTHNEFYYKMYYYVLREIVARGGSYRVFLDIKDTRSGFRTEFLKGVLRAKFRDWEAQRIKDIQVVRSDQVQQIQLADLLAGAVSYASRGLQTSEAKLALVRAVTMRSGLDLTRSSPRQAHKLNIFHWPTGGIGQ